MKNRNLLSHPDDLRQETADLETLQYVIRMTYDIALCHPDEMTDLVPKT